jgi:lipoate-protein ligase A
VVEKLLPLQVWPVRVEDGARNMALDEAAMEGARRGAVVFRTYGWDPECVSLGRNQPTAGELGGRPLTTFEPGVDVVRRPTGGRAVFHGPEITYAFIAPERLLGGPKAIYRAVHAALADTLRALGVPLDEPGCQTEAGPGGPPLDLDECFISPAPGEITAGGRKLVGSAQWRHRGAVLQHGSLLLTNRQERASVGGEGGGRAIALDELGPVPRQRSLTEGFADFLAAGLGSALKHVEMPPDVASEAARLEVRYRSREWTWRR